MWQENTQPGAAGVESELRNADERIAKQTNTIDGTQGGANPKTRARGGTSRQGVETRGAASRQAGGEGYHEIRGGSSGASFVPAVQTRLGGHGRKSS
jgi:hypothetical protein